MSRPRFSAEISGSRSPASSGAVQEPCWPVTMHDIVGIPSAMIITMANQLAGQHNREAAERTRMAWIRTRASLISLIGSAALVLLLLGALLP